MSYDEKLMFEDMPLCPICHNPMRDINDVRVINAYGMVALAHINCLGDDDILSHKEMLDLVDRIF